MVLSACSPTTEPTLCDRIAGEDEAVIDSLLGFASDEDLTEEQIDAFTLVEMPITLQTVLDFREFFIARDHPLVDTLPGTEIDPIESLDGCWGRVEVEQLADDGSFAWEVAEAWRIDLAAGTLDEFILKGVDGVPCLSDDRPMVQTFVNTIVETSETRITLRTDDGQAAGLEDDETLGSHELAVVGVAVSIDRERFFYFTVDGDYLISSEEGYDPQEPLRADMDFWVKFGCPEQG